MGRRSSLHEKKMARRDESTETPTKTRKRRGGGQGRQRRLVGKPLLPGDTEFRGEYTRELCDRGYEVSSLTVLRGSMPFYLK
jgi:hypothetical protein